MSACEHAALPFLPELTDQEDITMEVCGEYFKHLTDKDLFDYKADFANALKRLGFLCLDWDAARV